ncbi:MoxR family ATPase [Oscillospiraceae bacterium OttesenSCG-928-F05]|nr:MoxR family ATPase [Oscillospiraceae bacterium OttesenSCG-928-F05]
MEKTMDIQGKLNAIQANIDKVLVGKREPLELIMTAILARGHVLVEDVPGIGKTTLISALAASLGLSFQRIQFTPDVMPSDITGFSIYDMKSGEMRYQKGAVLNNVLLADEINRTSPKTQSSLLEVMQENQVTVDGQTHKVPTPFVVLATQNPVEHVGTFPLPEAQLDRFLIRVTLGYPGIREEIDILSMHDGGDGGVQALSAVVSGDDVIAMQKAVDGITCSDAVKEYIALLVGQTRTHADLLLGASPRAGVALMRAAKAHALLHGSDFVQPDDVQKLVAPVLAHRLVVRPEARLKEMTAERILKNITNVTRMPDAL